MLEALIFGFSVAFQPTNLAFCFLGVLMGTLVGVMPGFGPVAAMALTLPITFHFPPVSAIILLSGIYYGAMYGGSTTSILLNIPGEAASVVTCLDGYQMAKDGRAGPALGISAFGSFIAGTMGLIGLMLLAPTLSKFALKFGSIEFSALIILAFSVVLYLARGSRMKALLMAFLGIMLGTVGWDSITGEQRFTYGSIPLMDGIGLVPMVMGLFGVGEVLNTLEEKISVEILKTKIKGLFPSKADWRLSIKPIFRGSIIGFILGILPGAGALISTFVSYTVEKKLSKFPEKFGTGVIEGVAGPESANNAATAGAFIPLMTLGIPPNVVMAILMSAFIIHGVQPGPSLIIKHPEIFWGTISSMYIGNIMLLVLNLPLIPLWVQVLRVPYKFLFPMIILFCLVGVYEVNNRESDILIMTIFGILGYAMKKFKLEPAPLVLAFLLGPILEINLRQTLIKSDGNFGIFLESPISAFLLFIVAILWLTPILITMLRRSQNRKKRGYDSKS